MDELTSEFQVRYRLLMSARRDHMQSNLSFCYSSSRLQKEELVEKSIHHFA
ncbi:hypothetical protein [Terribacillus saccharophilus]|uniref:hypothetical protein n=1 Tax=Terribacillus saccharophilus TaxID=361277 RepID=UPI002989B5DE|nr:hypothetical protein [Terribacillus saccharophilus]MCM3226933.1 hypothetical protein [Terribacillus saccharophilus]